MERQEDFYSPESNAGDDGYRIARCSQKYFVERESGLGIFHGIPVVASKCQRNFQPGHYPSSCLSGSCYIACSIVSAMTESLHWHIVSLGRSFSNCPQFRGKTNQ